MLITSLLCITIISLLGFFLMKRENEGIFFLTEILLETEQVSFLEVEKSHNMYKSLVCYLKKGCICQQRKLVASCLFMI